MALELSSSRIYPVSPETAYDACLGMSLPQFLARRFAALPAVREVRDQHAWASVGDTRTIVLADGTTSRETLTALEPHQFFTYRLDQLTGPLKLLAADVRGRFSFEPTGSGAQVTWSWSVDPTRLGAPIMPVFGWMWRGWARQAMDQLGHALA